jgi:hypothetical protein
VWDGLRISLSDAAQPPFAIDAEVCEEDTALILSAERQIRQPSESLQELSTTLHDSRPARPGSVIIRPGNPPRLLAIVHDLDREPSWREGWICRALTRVLSLSQEHALTSLSLPLLGTAHGRIDTRRALYLTLRTLAKRRNTVLEQIWMRLTPNAMRLAQTQLNERIAR